MLQTFFWKSFGCTRTGHLSFSGGFGRWSIYEFILTQFFLAQNLSTLNVTHQFSFEHHQLEVTNRACPHFLLREQIRETVYVKVVLGFLLPNIRFICYTYVMHIQKRMHHARYAIVHTAQARGNKSFM